MFSSGPVFCEINGSFIKKSYSGRIVISFFSC
jgi:hypothetical protein